MEMSLTLGAICNPAAPRPTAEQASRSAFILGMVAASFIPPGVLCAEVLASISAQDAAIRRQFCGEV